MDGGRSFEPPDIGTWSRDPLGDLVDVLVFFFVLLTQVGPRSVVRKSGSGDQSRLLTCVLLLEDEGHVLARLFPSYIGGMGRLVTAPSRGSCFLELLQMSWLFLLVCVSTTTWTRDGVCFLPLQPWSDGGLA